MDRLLFKNKSQVALSRQICQKQNQKQKRQAISGKRDYSVRNFISVLKTARKIPKNKGKTPDKMCQLIFLKIYPQ